MRFRNLLSLGLALFVFAAVPSVQAFAPILPPLVGGTEIPPPPTHTPELPEAQRGWGSPQASFEAWDYYSDIGWVFRGDADSAWHWHPDMGWIWLFGDPETPFTWWIWSPETGWYWSSRSYFPWMWSQADDDWKHQLVDALVAPSLYRPITDVSSLGTAFYLGLWLGNRPGVLSLSFSGEATFRYFELDVISHMTETAEGWRAGTSGPLRPPGLLNVHAAAILFNGFKFFRVNTEPVDVN